jgi:hypothetical protein
MQIRIWIIKPFSQKSLYWMLQIINDSFVSYFDLKKHKSNKETLRINKPLRH